MREHVSAPVRIKLPDDFHYEECLHYLSRNANELLHYVDPNDRAVTKALKLGEKTVAFRLFREQHELVVHLPEHGRDEQTRDSVVSYIRQWFDLDTDLEPFYRIADRDAILRPVVNRYKGLRIIGVPDLFEACCWAVMGQQISLTVAYLLKKRFVEAFGGSASYDGHPYRTFPEFRTVARLRPADLTPLKFSEKKAEYVIGIARLMEQGQLNKESLLGEPDLPSMQNRLTAIRGIGAWTAHYVIMRCLRHSDAFPIADVGLHNALKKTLGLERKPGLDEIESWSANWGPWKAYATFYLWRSLTE